MSVVTSVRSTNYDVREQVLNFVRDGGKISVGKSKRKLPKYLRYSPFTANSKNNSPTLNPLKHLAGKIAD